MHFLFGEWGKLFLSLCNELNEALVVKRKGGRERGMINQDHYQPHNDRQCE
jgi:hypothetical protein